MKRLKPAGSTLVTVIAIMTATVITSMPARAGGLRQVDQTIFGMDCAPCAAGIERGLKKLPDVTAVRVSLNEGKAVVALGPGSRTTLAQIREVIRNNGFTPKEARATLVGRVVPQGNRRWIDTGSDRFLLAENSHGQSVPTLTQTADQEFTVVVKVPEKLANPPTAQLISVEPRK